MSANVRFGLKADIRTVSLSAFTGPYRAISARYTIQSNLSEIISNIIVSLRRWLVSPGDASQPVAMPSADQDQNG
jgi:hypothetical protein